MARGSNLMAQIQWDAIPMVQEAVEHVKADIFTGASTRNWAGYGKEVQLASSIESWQQNLLTDPQTSGGLLISCAPKQEAEVLSILNLGGFTSAQKIGQFVAGTGVSVA
jgi:selenide,water dikinase